MSPTINYVAELRHVREVSLSDLIHSTGTEGTWDWSGCVGRRLSHLIRTETLRHQPCLQPVGRRVAPVVALPSQPCLPERLLAHPLAVPCDPSRLPLAVVLAPSGGLPEVRHANGT
jgi:hypothetical protein